MIEWPSVYGVFLFSVQDALLGSCFSMILLDMRFGDELHTLSTYFAMQKLQPENKEKKTVYN